MIKEPAQLLKSKLERNQLRTPVYAGFCVLRDGFWTVIKNKKINQIEKVRLQNPKELDKKIFSYLRTYAIKNHVKIIAAGILDHPNPEKLLSDLWLKLDIVPFVFNIKNGGSHGKKKVLSAVIEAQKRFDNQDIIDVRFDTRRKIHTYQLARLEDFEKVTDKKTFTLAKELAEGFKRKKARLVFFSSTPRGGGVAIMRHGLIRFFRLLKVDAHWYVMSSKKEAFEITKKKFHNIFQAVAPPDQRLEENDKKILEKWTKSNVERFSPVFRNSDVIVIDDPQPAGMIPFIKKINPRAKIIFRSHIQMEASLVDEKGTAQEEVWNYLYPKIKLADIFVAHPVKKFVPLSISKKKTVVMPPSTDNLDGLNKKLSSDQIKHYLNLFNQELIKKNQIPLNIKRPFIIQISRFDPSKGIPDVLESYRKLRENLKKKGLPKSKTPQLVVTGHGSIDDPEGLPIYEEIMEMLEMDSYAKIKRDIKIILLPPSDQILNALLSKSKVLLQLSHKEGFEFKVTEGLAKGKPVIAYRAGGIPLQIEHAVTGFLVPIGKTEKVAGYLFRLFTEEKFYKQMSDGAKEKVKRQFFTVTNCAEWLYLANELLEKGYIEGNGQNVRKMMFRK